MGEHRGRVFLAMEFVAGQTLRDWVAGKSWQQIVAAFVAAARGLAAAHAIELVHRDFKPDNVMVGDDGRVRVMDFGLARSSDGDLSPAAGLAEAALSDSSLTTGSLGDGSLGDRVTQVGAIVGTPAYMAPEQHLGRPTTAAADQFSFCVALYESLYGVRPFVAPSLAFGLTSQGHALVLLGRSAEAIAPLERAVELRTQNPSSAVDLAESRSLLGRALWTAPRGRGRDRARARELAEQARAAYLEAEDLEAVAAVDTWLGELREHPTAN